VDFGPVVAGTFTNVGVQDLCPPGICDNFDLTVVLPAPATIFYQTMTAKLTINYTWFERRPHRSGRLCHQPERADHGPGSPDDTSTGAGIEVLTLTDPLEGVWHIRSVAALAARAYARPRHPDAHHRGPPTQPRRPRRRPA